MKYRVKVEVSVVVDAANQQWAKAMAEQGVRFAVSNSYESKAYPGWAAESREGFGFQAKRADRYEDETDE